MALAGSGLQMMAHTTANSTVHAWWNVHFELMVPLFPFDLYIVEVRGLSQI
jgi:hypothetical protein